jgi:hypothetical protein
MSLLRLIPLTALLLPALSLAASLPAQGVLRSQSGGPVADGAYLLTVSLYDAEAAKTPLHDELQKGVPVAGGAFDLVIGGIKPIPDELLTAGTALWLGISVGGEPELPRVKLHAVPRAWYAAMAGAGAFAYAGSDKPGGAAKGLACTGCVTGEHLAAGSVDAKHVAFTYAASQSKGGPADLALQAKVADNAKQAEKADELTCKGCVTLGHLGADVAKGFLPIGGGVLTGPLTAQPGVDLKGGVLQAARIGFIDPAKSVCDEAHTGLLGTSAQGQLWFCTGLKWKKVGLCGGDCKVASVVPCGLPITDDCGDAGACSGKGTYCDGAKSCTAGGCVGPGESAQTALASCLALKQKNDSLADGVYWINPTGQPNAAFQAWCDMTTSGGGWTRCLAHRYMPTLPNSYAKAWTSTVWSTTGKFAFANAAPGTDYGNFCTLIKATATQFYGQVRYPSGFGTDFTTNVLPLPANYFDANSQVIAKDGANHAIAKDNGTNGQGHYGSGCGTSYTQNKMQGIHAICLSNGAKYQAQHTGWLSGQYPGACPDSSNQPCTCTQENYCGGSDPLEKDIVMTLYLR